MSEQNDDTIGAVFLMIATIFTILFTIAPVVPYLKLIKSELSFKEVPLILLITSFITCYLWLIYGLWENKSTLYINNAIGGSITLLWMIIFIIYSTGRRFFISFGLMVLLMLIVLGLGALFYFVIGSNVTYFIVLFFNVLNYAAPSEKIFDVIKNGNYVILPIFSIIGVFVCSAVWLIYGIIESDLGIIISNALGLALGVAQVVVYFVFKEKANPPVKGKLKEGLKNNNEENDVDP